MALKKKRYSKKDLNSIFLDGLGSHIAFHSDTTQRPMLVDLSPRKLRLRVYIWNCTNPPGGRALDEYKFQIIMDSPFGRLSKTHKENVIKALPKMAEQVVLLAYYGEIDAQTARLTLGSELRQEYKLDKISSFHTDITAQ